MFLDPKELGEEGEVQARHYLERKGYRWVKSNFWKPFGEIDIIMRDGPTLVFVEVRTKTDDDFIHPLETITPAKQSKIIRAAMAYLKEEGLYDTDCRFDVMSMIPLTPLDWEIEHIENAFEVSNFS